MKRMNADDVIAVEELFYFYEQAYETGGHLHHAPALFCQAEDTEMHTHASRQGLPGIRAQYLEYYEGTPLYDTYHCGHQICTPVIEVEDGRARGLFPTIGCFINCCAGIPAKPIPDPPYTIYSVFECWYPEFAREHGLWKISNFNFKGLVGFGMQEPFWFWDPKDDGLAARSMLYTLSTPFPIMAYINDLARWEVANYEVQ